jgi:hypothetical protein
MMHTGRQQPGGDPVPRSTEIAQDLILRYRGCLGVGEGAEGRDGVCLRSEEALRHRAHPVGRARRQELRALVGCGAQHQFDAILLSCRDGLGRVSWQDPSVDRRTKPISPEVATTRAMICAAGMSYRHKSEPPQAGAGVGGSGNGPPSARLIARASHVAENSSPRIGPTTASRCRSRRMTIGSANRGRWTGV